MEYCAALQTDFIRIRDDYGAHGKHLTNAQGARSAARRRRGSRDAGRRAREGRAASGRAAREGAPRARRRPARGAGTLRPTAMRSTVASCAAASPSRGTSSFSTVGVPSASVASATYASVGVAVGAADDDLPLRLEPPHERRQLLEPSLRPAPRAPSREPRRVRRPAPSPHANGEPRPRRRLNVDGRARPPGQGSTSPDDPTAATRTEAAPPRRRPARDRAGRG